MNQLNFENYGYFPALRSRQAEMKGLAQLTEERKDKIIPLITLGKWPRSEDLGVSVLQAQKAMNNRPIFLDLTNEKSSLSNTINVLRDPANSFGNWIDFIKKFENVIPVIQFNPQQKIRDILFQSRKCEEQFGKVAFRVRDFTQSIDTVIAAVSSLDNVNNAIIFIDASYIRTSYTASLAATIGTINALRTQLPSVVISTLATSFPSQTGTFIKEDNIGIIDILERQLHNDLGGYDVVAYGDHGSIHSVVYDDVAAFMNWTARIDYPLESEWIIHRKSAAKSSSDYRELANKILTKYPNIKNSDIWGEKMIYEAAIGGITVGSVPASWIGVRVNGHLSRQIDYTSRLLSLNQSSDEDQLVEDLDF